MSLVDLSVATEKMDRRYEEWNLEPQLDAGRILIGQLALRAGERVLELDGESVLLRRSVIGIVEQSEVAVFSDTVPPQFGIAKRQAKRTPSDVVSALSRLADASFDVVYISAVSLVLLEELGSLRPFHRLLESGGRLGIAIVDGRFGTVQAVRKAVLARAPYVCFQESRAEAQRVTTVDLQTLLQQSGFAASSLESVPDVTIRPSARAAIDSLEEGVSGGFLSHLPDDLQHSARAEIARELDAFRVPAGIRLEGARIIAVAHRLGR